jgi:DNA-binding transcriptional MerR regulator
MRGFADGYRHGIGALADRSVSSTRTIKHQEELEFIKSGDRSSGGSRLYREDVERLEQILGERHGVHSTHEQRALAIRDVAKEADKVVVLNEVVKHLEEQEQQVDDSR